MIPSDAKPTGFAGVYIFRRGRYLVTASLASDAETFFAVVHTVIGTLQEAIDRRAQLLEELVFCHASEEPGPPPHLHVIVAHKPRRRRRRRVPPPGLFEDI